MSKFLECDTCRAKPGMPLLCSGCLTNREEIGRLEAQNEELKAQLRKANARVEVLEKVIVLEAIRKLPGSDE